MQILYHTLVLIGERESMRDDMLSGPELTLEKRIVEAQVKIEAWFREQWQKTQPPLYSSVDLRNAGFKVAPVDTNLFPAGFNNLNPQFMPLYVQAMQATVVELFSDVKRLLIIPESHTRNIFYFESLAMLTEIIQTAGFEVRIGFLDPSLTEAQEHQLPSGRKVLLEPLIRQGDKVGVMDYFPCCIILNNDLSDGVPEILQNLKQKMMPAKDLGWSTRLKSMHFKFYGEVAKEFSDLLGIDSWLINPWFDQCPEVDFMQPEGVQCVASRAEALLKRIQEKYNEEGVKDKPFLAIKADQGTYGMAVMMVQDAEELKTLNRKQRTRMSMAKGGKNVTKAIIQEGVYSFETVGEDNAVAEPVLYMIGRNVVGGFYRVHKNRGSNENLNSPGMNFEPLPISDPCNMPCHGNLKASPFYAYGVIARLATLGAAREMSFFKSQEQGQ